MNEQNCPTSAEIVAAFKGDVHYYITADKADAIVSLWTNRASTLIPLHAAPKTHSEQRGEQDAHNPHCLRVTSSSNRRVIIMRAINEIMNGHGVEAIFDNDSSPTSVLYEYVNTGDTYSATLIRDVRGDRLFLGCWGDVVEARDADGQTCQID